ncbi:MAG TPA: tetratricopeptide repeat protein [Thermoanaerobaculia bacterium]|jgi:tetratricopeptide (TPR) repeat protein
MAVPNDGVETLFANEKYAEVVRTCEQRPLLTDEERLLYVQAFRRTGRFREIVDTLATPGIRALTGYLLAELAYAHYMIGSYSEAIRVAEEALAADSTLELAIKAKGGSYRLRGLPDDQHLGRNLLDAAVKRFPESGLLAAERAAFYRSPLHDYETALGEAERALALDPALDTALNIAVPLLIRRGKNAAASAHIKQATEKALNDFRILTAAGGFALQDGNAEIALKMATSAEEIAPQHIAARLVRIESLLFLNRPGEALEYAIKACKELPKASELFETTARYLTQAGRFEEAQTLLDEMKASAAPLQSIYRTEIELLQRQGHWDQLTRVMDTALREAPNSRILKIEVAYSHVLMRQFDDAERLMVSILDDADEPAWADYVNILVIMSRLVRAREIVELGLERFPHSIPLKLVNAWLLASRGEYQQAHEAIDAHIGALTTKEWLYSIKIDALIMQWRLADAEKLACEAMKHFPLSTKLKSHLAQIYLHNDRVEEALTIIDEILEIDLSDTIPWQMKIAALCNSRRAAEALKLSEEAIARYPFSAGLVTQRGFVHLFAERDVDAAERDFLEAQEMGACGVLPWTGLGAVELQRGDTDRAEQFFRRALEIQRSPTTLLNHALAIVASRDSSRLQTAEEICTTVLRMHAGNPCAIACLGSIAYFRGDRPRAEAYLASVNPEDRDVEMTVNLGAVCARIGKYETAVAELEKALAEEPLHVRALVELSQVRLKQEKMAEARLAARRATDAAPDNSLGWRAAAEVAVAEGQHRTAEILLRDGLTRVALQQSEQLHLDLARVLLRLGDTANDQIRYRDALSHIAHIINRKPTHQDALLLRGLTELKLDQPGKALRTLAEVRETPLTAPYLAEYRYAARAQIRSDRLARSPILQAILIVFVCVQSGFTWWAVSKGHLESAGAAATIPLLCGILLLAVLLPRLSSFKVVSVEGQMATAPTESRRDNLAGPAMRMEAATSMVATLTALSYDV